ncbi:zinc-dependent peptidase [Flavobacterium sp.]|uniref:zinc-dependent peptidase n=1 Tax=Flavobacterium sp. TaxID=239 RepID=UPI002FD9CB1D
MIIILIVILALSLLALLLFFNIVFYVVEYYYSLVFGKPLFVHFYTHLKTLSPQEESILRQKFQFYNSLTDKKKHYFRHRVAKFLESYTFIEREDFLITNEVKLLVAATYVMLTFGMRSYLIDEFDKIILYPDEYYSTVSEEYHKGEFNPRLKAVVFSWKDFLLGYEISNDNLNLGIHEFTHVILFHGLKKNDASATIFSSRFNRLKKEVMHPPNRQRLINSNYFRVYAYTNEFEFVSVIIEHYFETPQDFKREFPELFLNVSLLLNYQP